MKPLRAPLATLAMALLAGCASPLLEPDALDTRALARSARDWTPATLASELPVDTATRRVLEAGLQELHTSLLGLHQRLEAQGAGESEIALTPEMEKELREVHARHAALWNSLDEEVRVTLARRFHEHASRHGGAAPASLHERLRRLHGNDAGH